MDKQDDPAATTDEQPVPIAPIEDLATSDARAFAAANALPSRTDPKIGPEPPSPPPNASDRIVAAVNHAQTTRAQTRKRKPIAIYVAGAVLIIVVVTLVLVASKSKTASSNTSSSGGVLTVPTPSNSDTNGFSGNVQQDIKTCSNAVNAALEC
jgi:hypothetical protein